MAKKYIDAEVIKSTRALYFDIDSCITELIRARTEHNEENEGKALFRMEGLMVATMQQLDCIIDSLQQEQSCNRAIYLDVIFSNMKRNEAIKQLEYLNKVYGEQPCDTCTNDKGCVTCKDGELWEGKEQSSEDLEKEIDKTVNECTDGYNFDWDRFARHFYKLGKQSKK